MSEQERYVDPNSGAAPQPGSFAGAHAQEKGFGPPPVAADGTGLLEEEPVPSAYEAPDAPSNPTPTPSEAFGLETAASAPAEDEAEDEPVDEDELEPVDEDGATEAAGDGVEGAPVEVPADGTLSEPIEGDGRDGEPLDANQDGVFDSVEEEAAADAGFEQGNARAVVEEEPADTEVKDYEELLAGNLPEIQAYLDNYPEEKEAIVAAEAQGQNRKGVVEY